MHPYIPRFSLQGGSFLYMLNSYGGFNLPQLGEIDGMKIGQLSRRKSESLLD